MAIPVINTTTSVLGYKQWEYWEYQPFATNNPDSWACPNLPEGLEIDGATGKISGAAEVAGVFICGLVASAGSDHSAPLPLTIGITAAPAALTSSGYEVDIDVVSRKVSLVGGGDVKIFAAVDDDILLWIRFKKGEVYLDLPVTAISLALRVADPENNIILGDDFVKKGAGASAVYGLHAKASGDGVNGAIADFEFKKNSQFDGQTEIEWVQTNPDADDFGPETLTMSTRRFDIQIGSQYVKPA